MRYHSDVLRERLEYPIDNVNIEQQLDARFSQVYPTFDPNVHFAGMTDNDIPKDAPLDSPVIVGPNAPVLYPSIGYIPGDDHDEDSFSTHSAPADGHKKDISAPTKDHDDVFDEITLPTPAGEDGYGEGWGESSDPSVFYGSTVALLDPSTLAPTGEPPLHVAPDTPPMHVGSHAPPPGHPGPGAAADGNNNSVRDVERGGTQREEGDKKKHWYDCFPEHIQGLPWWQMVTHMHG